MRSAFLFLLFASYCYSENAQSSVNQREQSSTPIEAELDIQASEITHFSEKVQKTLLLAQKGRRSKPKRAGRKRFLTGEARTSGASTSIDFDAAAIEGERKAPVGVAVGGNRPDQAYDLIKLRRRWHPEMIKSTTVLESGRR